MIDEVKRNKQTELMINRVKRITENEQEMQEKPTISETTKKLAAKKTHNIPLEQRYTEEIKTKEIKMQKLKAQIELQKQSEEKECTFKPSINSKFPISQNSRPDFDNPSAALELKEKKLAKLKLDYLIEESQHLTFMPKINQKSEKLIGENEDLNFYDRMENYQALYKENLEKKRSKIINEQTPFQPNTRNHSVKSVSCNKKANVSRSISCKKLEEKNDKILKLKNIIKKSKNNETANQMQEVKRKGIHSSGYFNKNEAEMFSRDEENEAQNKSQHVRKNNKKTPDRSNSHLKKKSANQIDAPEYIPSIKHILKQSFLN